MALTVAIARKVYIGGTRQFCVSFYGIRAMMECLIEAERLFICDFPNAPFAWNLSTDWGLGVKMRDFFFFLAQRQESEIV